MVIAMMGKIKAALSVVREVRYLRSVLKAYGDRLAAGRYALYAGFRALALRDPAVEERAEAYFPPRVNKSWEDGVIRRLNGTGLFVNKQKTTTGEYEAFYTANNNDAVREVKLFSFRRGKMLTVCTCPEEAEKQIRQYETYGSTHPMPAVRKSDAYPNALEITMVDIRPFPGWDAAIREIACATANIPPPWTEVSGRVLASVTHENEEICSLLTSIAKEIDPAVLDLHYPLCVQHGDLSQFNLLYGVGDGKTGFWWIDWEHAGERLFFYDCFFYILHTAYYYDKSILERYLRGEADEGLEQLFSHFGLPYDREKRKDYFLLFAVTFLRERVCFADRVGFLGSYCSFLRQHCAKGDGAGT